MSILTLASYYDYYSSVWSVIIANATWKQPSQPQLNSFPPIIVVNIGPTPDVRCGWDHTAAWLCMNNNIPEILSTLNHCTIHSIPCKCHQPIILRPFPVNANNHPFWVHSLWDREKSQNFAIPCKTKKTSILMVPNKQWSELHNNSSVVAGCCCIGI